MVNKNTNVCTKEPVSSKFFSNSNPEFRRNNLSSDKTKNLFQEKEINGDTIGGENIGDFFTNLSKFLVQVWFL